MKKLFFLSAVFTVMTLAVSAQVKIKMEPSAIFGKKAQSALKTQGMQQGMKAVTPGDECGAFVATKKDDKGESYTEAKEFLIVSNDGVTGFAFTFYTLQYEGKTLYVARGMALEPGICVDNTSKVTITFDDGTQVTLPNFEKDNCKGIVSLYMHDVLKNMDTYESLKTKKVRSLKLEGVEKTVVKSFSEGNQQQMQGTFKCL
ncbi:MAG: hypothetical protein KF781_05960 [Chitinophagaceae bacterium]|nr:hypothetical protein [Chitinophagaceae bacterium]MCW5906059.1 hypothetical protein [Chitinophagaceae bacterium]